ncbi:hypothetical protein TW85_11735 [Marinomonas sp. S3726]|uniref:thioesterase II family protein n=1 Tax=Marinomonas sp. S3726 TaxID=579484 RepID=UPI0005FA6F83|nr:thioesterase domain-containing protein [Marinomonas sp. S3726]KJZ13860.1 hypothetical protein TW85_11735 [Marinomonas sp. S3726]
MTINLFCLPPAGSSASLYSSWNKLTQENINIIPLEYPGHGTLVRQKLIHDPEILTEALIHKIISYGDEAFAIFGHSVGAALLWRIEKKIRETPLNDQLKLLVVSGRPELEYTKNMAPKRFLTREGMIKALKHYNGVPAELLENQDAMNFFLNILRNDFHLNDMMLKDEIRKTKTPLLAFYGKEDPDIANLDQMNAWQNHSYNWQGCYPLTGGHFYFNDQTTLQVMLERMCRIILNISSKIKP